MDENTIYTAERKPAYTHFLLPGAILIAALLISGTLMFTRRSGTAVVTDPNAGAPAKPVNITVDNDKDHILGNKDAKVTIVEFSDFQCPFCRSFFEGAYAQIKTEYLDTGKARLVFRHFPLDFHPQSKIAAEASECASEQGKFWEMHDKMFVEQGKKGQGTVQFTAQDLKRWAVGIKLNAAQFNQCLDTNKYAARIEADTAYGSSIGVNGTPSFYINGQSLVGAQPFSAFKTVIDPLL